MSYILDAIRKAEETRKEETVPSLEVLIDDRRRQQSKSGRHRLIWLGLLILLGTAGYLYRDEVVAWSSPYIDKGKLKIAAIVTKGKASLQGIMSSDKTPQSETSKLANASGAASTNVTPSSVKTKLPEPAAATTLTNQQRQLLNGVKFTVVSYSKDVNKRFVMIGANVLREGQLLEGFPITAIKPDGVVVKVGAQQIILRP